MGWAKYFEDDRIKVEERYDDMAMQYAGRNFAGKDRVLAYTRAYPSNLSDFLAYGMMTTAYRGKGRK